MGAVGTLIVIVVGNVHTLVDVVGTEGQLVADAVAGGLLDSGALAGIQPGQDLGDFLRVQKRQGIYIGIEGLPTVSGILLQGIQEGSVVEGLVVGICAGVYNGDPGSRAGHAGGPDSRGAHHPGGGVHIRLQRFGFGCLVPALDDNILDTVNLFDLTDLAVGHIGGDDVAHQRQIPDNIQFLSVQRLGRDDLFHDLLNGAQVPVVGHGLRV